MSEEWSTQRILSRLEAGRQSRQGSGGGHCEVCGGASTHRKPWCREHVVTHDPYALELIRMVEASEQEGLRIEQAVLKRRRLLRVVEVGTGRELRRALRPLVALVDLEGVAAQDVRVVLRLRGQTTAVRIVRELRLSSELVALVYMVAVGAVLVRSRRGPWAAYLAEEVSCVA